MGSVPRYALVLAVPVLFLAACSEQYAYDPLAPGATVLAFGDSVTHGAGAEQGEDYPALLARATGWQVINAGIRGDTAKKAKDRLEELLHRHRPDMVIVELGGNDFLRKWPTSSVKDDLHTIITTCQGSGAITVLVAAPRLSLLRAGVGALKDSSIYQELAEETGAVLVEDIFSAILSDDQLHTDPVHPNARGYEVLTAGIVDTLRSQGLFR